MGGSSSCAWLELADYFEERTLGADPDAAQFRIGGARAYSPYESNGTAYASIPASSFKYSLGPSDSSRASFEAETPGGDSSSDSDVTHGGECNEVYCS